MIISVLGSSGQIGAYLTEYLRDKVMMSLRFDKNLGPEDNLTVIPNEFVECYQEC